MVGVVGYMLIYGLFCLIGAIIGNRLHEATHALVARTLGSPDVQVDWFAVSAKCYYAIPDHWTIWDHRAVRFAPLTIGIVIGFYMVLMWEGAWWIDSWLGGLIAFGWFTYTIFGGMSDFSQRVSLERAQPDHGRSPEPK